MFRIYAEFWKKILKNALVGCHKNLVHQKINAPTIQDTGKSFRSCRSVRHELTPQKTQHRVDIYRQLIGNSMNDKFIRRIVTYDKNGYITATLTPRNNGSVTVNLPTSPLKNLFGPKVMFCVWWNFEGVIHCSLFQTDMKSMRIFILNN